MCPSLPRAAKAVSRSAIDVAIVGGGPAGSAAALTLARYTRRSCALFEASRYEATRTGECVSPAILPLLDYLGVAPPGVPDEMIPCHGAEARWGGSAPHASASIFNQAGAGWTLDRRAFDLRLARAAQDAGVQLSLGTSLASAARHADGWRLTFTAAGGAETAVIARQVIDATGRSAVFARKVAARRRADDRLVALVAYARRARAGDGARLLRLESVPNGWWYMAALPGKRAIVALFTDADLVRRAGALPARTFARSLAATHNMQAWLAGYELIGVPRAHRAEGSMLLPPVGRSWLAAGDAASSFDPLSSLGIGHAITSGIQAARIVHARLDADEILALAYADDLARNHDAYRARLAEFYGAERGWPASAFWQRRLPDQADNRARKEGLGGIGPS